MIEQMEFPITFEEFAKEYGFNDHRHIYTNGSDLIPIFRVKQWLEHDNKLRKIETDTAYECGKHANKWISVSERLPKKNEWVLVTVEQPSGNCYQEIMRIDKYKGLWTDNIDYYTNVVKAWMPLPKPYKEDNNG